MVTPRRGDVWWGESPAFDPRPFLVLTRDEAIPVLERVVLAPVTRTIRGIPSELPLGPDDGLRSACVASFDNLVTLPKGSLVRRMGALAPARLREACDALRASMDC